MAEEDNPSRSMLCGSCLGTAGGGPPLFSFAPWINSSVPTLNQFLNRETNDQLTGLSEALFDPDTRSVTGTGKSDASRYDCIVSEHSKGERFGHA